MDRLCGLGLLLLGIATVYVSVLIDRPVLSALVLVTTALGMMAMGGVMMHEGGRHR